MRKILFSCFLIISFLTGIAIADVVQGPEEIYTVEYSMWYNNGAEEEKNVKVGLPAPMDEKYHQELAELDYKPKPEKIVMDSTGDMLVFLFKTVAPGKELLAKVKSKVKNHRVVYILDADKITDTIPPSVKPFLKSTRRFPADDSLVKRKLKKAAGNEKNRFYRFIRIYDYIRALKFQLSKKPQTVKDVLKTGVCQCSDASDLMVTMCRSAGIPARYVGGIYMTIGTDNTEDTHAWVEAYFHPYGWIPADPTMGRFNYFTRLSRLAEIDGPYLTLWKDREAPFHMWSPDKKKFSEKRMGKKITYQSKNERKGIDVTKIYKDYTIKLKDGIKAEFSTNDFKARDYYFKASGAESRGDFDKAEKLFRKAIDQDPGLTDAYAALFRAYQRRKKLDNLEYEMKALLKVSKKKANALMVLGLINANRKNYSSAFDYYRNARKAGVKSYILDLQEGGLYMETKQVGKAAEYLNRAYLKNPFELQNYSYQFDLLNYLEDFNAVAELCDQGYKIHKLPDFMFQKAKAYMNLNKLKKAEKAAQKAVEKAPKVGSFWGVLGRIHIGMGKKEEGRKEILKALKLGVNAFEAGELRQVLKDNDLKQAP